MNSVVAAQKQLKAGNDICPNLSALEIQVTRFVPKKITPSQQTALDNSIDGIKAELGC